MFLLGWSILHMWLEAGLLRTSQDGYSFNKEICALYGFGSVLFVAHWSQVAFGYRQMVRLCHCFVFDQKLEWVWGMAASYFNEWVRGRKCFCKGRMCRMVFQLKNMQIKNQGNNSEEAKLLSSPKQTQMQKYACFNNRQDIFLRFKGQSNLPQTSTKLQMCHKWEQLHFFVDHYCTVSVILKKEPTSQGHQWKEREIEVGHSKQTQLNIHPVNFCKISKLFG